MIRMVVTRTRAALLTLLLVSALIFLATIALPGDVAVAVLGKTATPESLAAFRADNGLGRPPALMFLEWVGGLFVGDFGYSVVSGEAVSSIIATRGGRTAILMTLAIVIGFPLGTLIGTLMAMRRNGAADSGTSLIMLVLTSLPEFVLAVLVVILFSTGVWHLFPAVSLLQPDVSVFAQGDILVLPVLTLILAIVPYIALTTRSSMIEVLADDFVAMARLKGVSEARMLWHHALPSASAPLIQVFAVTVVFLAGGTIVVETVFQFPGLGSGLIEAVRNRDVFLVQALTLLLAAIYIVGNLIADVLVVLVTPRLRTKAARLKKGALA